LDQGVSLVVLLVDDRDTPARRATLARVAVGDELTGRDVTHLALGAIGEAQRRWCWPMQRGSFPVAGHARRGLHERFLGFSSSCSLISLTLNTLLSPARKALALW
jgi:hypothetical protein